MTALRIAVGGSAGAVVATWLIEVLDGIDAQVTPYTGVQDHTSAFGTPLHGPPGHDPVQQLRDADTAPAGVLGN
ncbi:MULTISPECIES: hypothetical protein [Streptomyces]|uniref:Uncharacterized protein n=1 Tax=Streptomyces doebereineriae TaxID=3075528 RepID=A0ABU2VJ82_9ACTN|nr:hypothetical protein [Streptomyces sp. DSM 41640]MDT0485368.1 hypothetical protein [Streptomyces sp. DSM 41640]